MKYLKLKLCTFSICLISFLLTGCATGYGPLDSRGGYEDSKIDENTYSVSFKGNLVTSKERVLDFAVLRAAELCLQSGLTHFKILQQGGRVSTFTPVGISPGTVHDKHEYILTLVSVCSSPVVGSMLELQAIKALPEKSKAEVVLEKALLQRGAGGGMATSIRPMTSERLYSAKDVSEQIKQRAKNSN